MVTYNESIKYAYDETQYAKWQKGDTIRIVWQHNNNKIQKKINNRHTK